jgi:putative DNA primase/helicase
VTPLLITARSAKPVRPVGANTRSADDDDFRNSPFARRRAEIDDAFRRTDLAHARLLVQVYGHKIRYVAERKHWIIYDGQRWVPDELAIRGLAISLADLHWSQAKEEPDPQIVVCLVSQAERWSSRRGLDSAVALAAAMPGVVVSTAHLDASLWLLNCPNGTVDLRTGELQPHRPEDLLTQLCPVCYVPEARNTDWDHFLDAILPADVRPFLQRVAGLCVSGVTREQILPILVGAGSNGKSTFLNALCGTLGLDYAAKSDHRLLMANHAGRHTTERMDLHGRRLVVASETEAGALLAEAQIKELTGGEPIRGRRMRQDSWEFTPTHQLMLATNHPPEIRGTDHAIWRRIMVVPFQAKFWDPARGEHGPAHLRIDRSFADRLVEAQPAILAWMVQGCLAWQRDGLKVPETILEATRAYRQQQDRISAFLDDCCRRVPGERTQSGLVYEAYLTWCRDNCETPLKCKAFSTRIKETYDIVRSNGSWFAELKLR